MDYMERIDKAFATNLPETQLTMEDARLLMSLLMNKDENLGIEIDCIDKNSEIYQHFKPLINSFIAQIFLRRIENMTTLKMTLGGLIMLLLHMESPGNAVMYAYYLHGKLAPKTLVNLDVLSRTAFPWGMFSKKQLDDIWAAQKRNADDDISHCVGAGDNLLDYMETWKPVKV